MKIGILSDTHRHRPDPEFTGTVRTLFAGADLVLHAGDLTSAAVLEAFGGIEVLAVHGNMCDSATCRALPAVREIEADGFSIVLTHGSGPPHGIEDRLLSRFGDADCIVYGHTHIPAVNRYGHVLMVNPGSFGFGRGGTCAFLKTGADGIRAEIVEVPRP